MPEPNRGRTLEARCCVVGGGPAGMMLGYLLARAGVDVVVLEKHADFLRDFRGDTIHPSTLEVLSELGLLDAFLARPHQEAPRLGGVVGGVEFPLVDFSRLPTRCRFIAFMPQWHFLDFLVEHARSFPAFRLVMRAEVHDLIEDGGRVVGVRARTPDGPLEVRAGLTVGADGRHSTVRDRAGLRVIDSGVPIDVLWLRLPRRPGDPELPLGRFGRGKVFVMIDRGDYWQCAFVIPKGGDERVRGRGLEAFRREIVDIAPFLADRVDSLEGWDDVKLLTVLVDHLERWDRPGLLCIGDAAHAMSPVGGVGINLAIQDAVATANLLAAPLRDGTLTDADAHRVQRRREFPARMTQRLQLLVQDRIINRVLSSKPGEDDRPKRPPWPVRLLGRWPILRRIPARIIGIGFRPEHVRSPRAHRDHGRPVVRS